MERSSSEGLRCGRKVERLRDSAPRLRKCTFFLGSPSHWWRHGGLLRDGWTMGRRAYRLESVCDSACCRCLHAGGRTASSGRREFVMDHVEVSSCGTCEAVP